MPAGGCTLAREGSAKGQAQVAQEGSAMAYRYQVTCVGWWRGKIKRWNTTFHRTTATGIPSLYSAMQAAGYPNPGDATGACAGGVASIARYASTGGAPLDQTVYFDWETPSTWIPYTGSAWSSVTTGTPIDASGESALVVVGNMAGLSSTGKPVTTRKYLHAIPSRTAADYADPDVSSAVQAAIEALFPTTYMLNPSGVAPTSVEVEPWYFNHQRVRGRRRTTSQVAAQSFSAGVVAGAASGGASPAQFQ